MEPDDRDGADMEGPRLPDERGGAILRGREVAAGLVLAGLAGRVAAGLAGRAGLALAGLAGRVAAGLALVGLAGRALVPAGRLVVEGRTPVAGCLDVPEGRTALPAAGRLEVPVRTPCVLRVPLVVPRFTALRVPPRTPEDELPRVATERVEIRPLASRDMAVRVAEREAVRDVRVFIRSRVDERATIWRLLMIMVPG